MKIKELEKTGEQVILDNNESLLSATEDPATLSDLMFSYRTNKMNEILEENYTNSQLDSLDSESSVS